MKRVDKTEQSDRAPNPNEKPESCYCSALPNGTLCLPCYTRWLAMSGDPGNVAMSCSRRCGGIEGRSWQHQSLCTLPMLGPPFALGGLFLAPSIHAAANEICPNHPRRWGEGGSGRL